MVLRRDPEAKGWSTHLPEKEREGKTGYQGSLTKRVNPSSDIASCDSELGRDAGIP
jgi:hypothetical protein